MRPEGGMRGETQPAVKLFGPLACSTRRWFANTSRFGYASWKRVHPIGNGQRHLPAGPRRDHAVTPWDFISAFSTWESRKRNSHDTLLEAQIDGISLG